MVLLASTYDESKYFKAADLAAEKKLRIKNVTEEQIGMDKDKEHKLVVWFTNDKHGLILNRVNNRTIRGAFGDAVDVSDHGGIPRQDGTRPAGAHPAAEAATIGCSGSTAAVAVRKWRDGSSAAGGTYIVCGLSRA